MSFPNRNGLPDSTSPHVKGRKKVKKKFSIESRWTGHHAAICDQLPFLRMREWQVYGWYKTESHRDMALEVLRRTRTGPFGHARIEYRKGED